jgi:oxaloacetate decarboxylase gamma subunit
MTPDNVMSQLTDAIMIMIIGMAVVFIFLSLLIVATKLLSKFCRYFERQDSNNHSISNHTSVNASPNDGISLEQVPPVHVAAISAALREHCKRHNLKRYH